MHPPKSPVVAMWMLALRLRRRREQLGIDVKFITGAMDFTRNYWSAVENERKLLSEDALVKLLDLLEFDKDERRELLELRTFAKQRGWWTQYAGLLDANGQRLYGLEAGADGIRDYESLVVPGLLQTPDYARAIMTPDVTVRQVEVDQLVELRMQRRQYLTGETPLHLTALISEAVLRQEIGGLDVHRRQLQHLVDAMEEHSNTIEIRVIPFTVSWCSLFGGATLHMIDFEDPNLPTQVWQETVTARGFVDDRTLVRDITTAYSDTFRLTLTVQESLSMIRRRIEELA